MIELHLHLDGSLRPATVWDLAKEQGIDLGCKDLEELTTAMEVPANCTSLPQFLERFQIPLLVLQTAEALRRTTFELVEDLAKEGLTYAEIRFAPLQSVRGGLTQKEVCEAVMAGARQGMAQYPTIRVGIILCCMRGPDLDKLNLDTVETAHELLGDLICAVDLAGAESLFPTPEYAPVFARARALGVPFTIHAGEAAGPDSIRTALAFGTKRLGHGFRAAEDPELVAELARTGVTLEVCITSNVQTMCVPSLAEHPVKKLYDAGVRVTLNSDNRTVSRTTLAQELALAKSAFGFTDADIQKMQQYARDAAFLK